MTQQLTMGDEMTKTQYIEQHPKSTLARRMAGNAWPGNTRIHIVGGLDGRYSNRGNLVSALGVGQECERGGHRWRGTEGWWWAVTINLAKVQS